MEMITEDQVLKRYGGLISKGTLRRWVRLGRYPAPCIPGGGRSHLKFYALSEIEEHERRSSPTKKVGLGAV